METREILEVQEDRSEINHHIQEESIRNPKQLEVLEKEKNIHQENHMVIKKNLVPKEISDCHPQTWKKNHMEIEENFDHKKISFREKISKDHNREKKAHAKRIFLF